MSKPRVQMNCPEHHAPAKNFIDIAQTLQAVEGWRPYEAFQVWIETSARALLSKVLASDKKLWQANEDEFLKIQNRFRSKDITTKNLGHMLAITSDALAASPVDFLSPLFMEFAANSHIGQFFTPHGVSLLIAQMTLSDAPALLKQARLDGANHITCQEPACGVGGMVLAANQVFREHQIDPSREVLWTCIDVDLKACFGTFIQASLTNSAAIVVHGNTLTLEEWGRYPTMAAMTHKWISKPEPLAA